MAFVFNNATVIIWIRTRKRDCTRRLNQDCKKLLFPRSRKDSNYSKKFLFSGACMRRLMSFSLHFIQTHTTVILLYLTDIQTTNRQYLSHHEHTEHISNIVKCGVVQKTRIEGTGFLFPSLDINRERKWYVIIE